MTGSEATGTLSGRGQQVAALCWRKAPHLEILLVTSLRTRRWILPKGWVAPDLGLAGSAAREALEEAGVTGRVAETPLGHYHYLKEKGGVGTPCRVHVFALEARGQRRHWPEKSRRDHAWLRPGEAAARIAEPGLRRIVTAFARSIAQPRRRIA
jgi:8-oxo-dGTP pyrophosphatase MutT (NUDIX family)